MSLKLADLSVLAYANNFTLWHYKTTDTKPEVCGEGYFDTAADMMRANDLIIANADGGAGPMTKFLIVTEVEAGKVKVAVYQ